MIGERNPLYSVSDENTIDVDAEIARAVNEKTAIICGMADLLLDSNGALDQSVARAALDSIKRHASGLRELFHDS